MEDIRLLVQEEGRQTRNFIAFNVPVVEQDTGKSATKKPPTSPRPHIDVRKDDIERQSKRTADPNQSGSRVRSASTGRDKKSELQARYWAFLFGNLQRAVDEIYQTCESDESVTECKEVMMVLDNYTRDFHNLIEWFKIKWEYEKTPPPQRPTSLAWEVRKSSPGKISQPKTTRHLSFNDRSRNLFLNNSVSKLSVSSNGDDATKNDQTQTVTKQEDKNESKEEVMKTQESINETFLDENVQVESKPVSTIDPSLTMVDEVCQTDREEDVDENGPKYRSASQQTCPILSGLTNSEAADIKSENANVIMEKAMKPAVEVKTRTSMAPVKSTYSAATNVKASTIQPATKVSTPTKIQAATTLPVKGRTGTKPAYSTVSRQPWGARSVTSRPLTVTTGSIKLVRSRTATEVRVSRVNQGPVVPSTLNKPLRPALAPRQDVKQPLMNKKPVSNTSNLQQSLIQSGGRTSTSNSTTSLNSTSSGVSFISPETSASTETLTPDNVAKEDDDGWVKVKSRSRFSPSNKIEALDSKISKSANNIKLKIERKGSVVVKSNPRTRFSQPSSAVSLPALALAVIDIEDVDDNKSTAHNKHRHVGKSKENVKPDKNRARNGKKACGKNEVDDKENCNVNMKDVEVINNIINTNCKMKDEKKYVELIDQDTMFDDEEFDKEIKKNKETEEMLQKEIHELEATDVELDVETGDEETDGETTTGTEDEPDSDKKIKNIVVKQLEREPSPKRQDHYEAMLNGMSWADQVVTLDELEKLVVQDCSKRGMSTDEQRDTLERLEELVARYPGRALELHQKLSSPSRRRTVPDTVNRLQARQAKASEKREQLKMEKAQRLRELLNKVDEVKAAKEKLIEERRQRLEMKLKRAAQNRTLHLKEIMRKAHDEEEKLKEIAFINELEAQNKRHDFMALCQEQEDRLQGIHEERQRKQEEKAAKEAAVEERRKALEAERQDKLEKMQERQRKRDEQADKKKQEKEKERQELAREKARDRTERLEALHAAQLEAQEELQKKIQQKQEDSARRHEENMEQIRQKALELSILKCSDDVAPRLVLYDTQKLCTACNVLINSDVYLLSHLRGKKHLEAVRSQNNGKELIKEELEKYNIKIIVNAPADKVDPKIALDKERVKCLKRKCKKIRLRMLTKGEDYMKKHVNQKLDSPNKGKLQKSLKDVEKLITSQGAGQWSDNAITSLERAMGELGRTLFKKIPDDQIVFQSLAGFNTLSAVLKLDMDVPHNMTPYLPNKCFVTTCNTYITALQDCANNCNHVLLSNIISVVLDMLYHRLSILLPDRSRTVDGSNNGAGLPVDLVAGALMKLVAVVLTHIDDSEVEDFVLRVQDVISYTVSVGIIDKLAIYCELVRDPIDNDPQAAQFLLNALQLLSAIVGRYKTVRRGNEDPTHLKTTLQVTELVGAVSILYGMLLHQDAPQRQMECEPPSLTSYTTSVALATIRLLHCVAELDLHLFQGILGAEGISLQFRHIASYLLWYCSHHDKDKQLLHLVVAVVGFFAVEHKDNQMMLQSGYMPSVLQQLCNLPFQYFTNSELSLLLFPTLLACCANNKENRAILEQEISYTLLEDFLTTAEAKQHPLVLLLDTAA